jgi:hypothetical protein
MLSKSRRFLSLVWALKMPKNKRILNKKPRLLTGMLLLRVELEMERQLDKDIQGTQKPNCFIS